MTGSIGAEVLGMARQPTAEDNIIVLFRADSAGRLANELFALFSYSIARALESLEKTSDAQVRITVTRQVIDPLERARERLRRHRGRRRPGLRLVLPRTVVTLADVQYRALCAAAGRRNFCHETLPAELRDPVAAHHRFRQCAGLETPRELPSPTRRENT